MDVSMRRPLTFTLRKPRFPILVDTGKQLLCYTSPRQCAKLIRADCFSNLEPRPIIDISGEGHAIYPEFMAISPLTTKKRWTKKELITLYNSRRSGSREEFAPRSLGNKRFDVLFQEIVELVKHVT